MMTTPDLTNVFTLQKQLQEYIRKFKETQPKDSQSESFPKLPLLGKARIKVISKRKIFKIPQPNERNDSTGEYYQSLLEPLVWAAKQGRTYIDVGMEFALTYKTVKKLEAEGITVSRLADDYYHFYWGEPQTNQ